MKDHRRNSRISKRQRKKQADTERSLAIEEIAEYFDATKSDPTRELKCFGEWTTYLSHPRVVKIVRQALIDALEEMQG